MNDRSAKTLLSGSAALLRPGTFDQIRLAWRLLRDPRVTPLKNALPILALLYVVSPIDLLPDLLPAIGQVDDLGVLATMVIVLVQLLPRLAPGWVVREHLAAMGLADHQPVGAEPNPGPVVDAAYRVRR